eukprot:16293367-Heterocapsa_arctica.AAC.1
MTGSARDAQLCQGGENEASSDAEESRAANDLQEAARGSGEQGIGQLEEPALGCAEAVHGAGDGVAHASQPADLAAEEGGPKRFGSRYASVEGGRLGEDEIGRLAELISDLSPIFQAVGARSKT